MKYKHVAGLFLEVRDNDDDEAGDDAVAVDALLGRPVLPPRGLARRRT
ncbi:MAG: hypothetical protein WKF75_00230 [Singulisphaera sp.]